MITHGTLEDDQLVDATDVVAASMIARTLRPCRRIFLRTVAYETPIARDIATLRPPNSRANITR